MTLQAEVGSVPAAQRAPMLFGRIQLVPLIVATAMFMEAMDSTILTTALPAIAQDLSVDPISLKLAVTSYLVGLAIVIPISGWVADRLGASVTFRMALGIFMAASIGCAMSHSMAEFVVWRFIQGVGGAMMSPVGRMVVIRMMPKAELVRAFALLATPMMVGPMMGPPLGGFIVTYATWPWIFFVNIPFGILGIWLASMYMSNDKGTRKPLDVTGFLLCALTLSGLVLGAAIAGRHLAPPVAAVTLAGIGFVSAFYYVRHARRVSHPLLDLGYLRIQTFRAGVLGGIFFRMGVGASMFLLPLMLQLGFEFSALRSGLIVLALAVGSITLKPLTSSLLRRIGFTRVLNANSLANALALILMGLMPPTMPFVLMFVCLFVAGGFRSVQFTSLNAISFADIEGHRVSEATSVANVSQQMSISLGVGVGAMALELASFINGHDHPLSVDFTLAFLVIGTLSGLSGLWLWTLPSEAGHELSGQRGRA